MVIVALKETGRILNRFEAWATNSVETACRWAVENGYKLLGDEITLMGDMVIWVA